MLPSPGQNFRFAGTEIPLIYARRNLRHLDAVQELGSVQRPDGDVIGAFLPDLAFNGSGEVHRALEKLEQVQETGAGEQDEG